MTLLAYIALVGWIPCVIAVFALWPARQAAPIAMIGATLLLPAASLQIAGLPDYSKNTAATVGIMLGTLIFTPDRLMMFRPRWFDLPMVLWCFAGIATSLQNGLGLYDGLSDALNNLITWGLPYFIGRLHFADPESLRSFATGMAIGSLCYVPLCLYEQRMMMSLQLKIYGVGGWGGASGLRWGGYRPSVFFGTGLELGLWMCAASLAGWWLWRCGALKKIGSVPFGSVLLPILMGTAVLCRSTGALLLMAAGMMILWLSVRFQTRLILAALLLIGPVYVVTRTNNVWSGQQATDIVKRGLSEDRALSLQYRFTCEELLIDKALQRPVLGWGGWGRSAVYFNDDKPWRKRVETDGLWVIFLGIKGYVGLILFYLAMVLPVVRFIMRFPARLWGNARLAAGSLTAVLLGLYMIDCLMNGFANIIYVTLAGGLAGLEPRQLRLVAPGSGLATAADTHKNALADHNYRLGRTLKVEGRLQEAEAVWQHTLDLLNTLLAAHPGHPDVRRRWCDCANDLAWLKLRHPEPAHGDPFSAITLARRAVGTCPDGATYWNTLGTAYFRAGNDALAVAALDRAKTLGGGTAFDDVFLAMAHARLGNRELAEQLFAQAHLQMERDYPAHPELVRFCDEARLILAKSSEEAAVV